MRSKNVTLLKRAGTLKKTRGLKPAAAAKSYRYFRGKEVVRTIDQKSGK
jgi:hypothetical protein